MSFQSRLVKLIRRLMPAITTNDDDRWELPAKHWTYGSLNTGFRFTELIAPPCGSGLAGQPIVVKSAKPKGLTKYQTHTLHLAPLTNIRVRCTFPHGSSQKTGVTELLLWPE